MEHPGAYARRVMFSLVLDGGRKRSRRKLELVMFETTPAAGGEETMATFLDSRADLIRALAELPARQRAVLVLRYFADLPEAEIATILGCPVGTVKSTASRALERLRQVHEMGARIPAAEPSAEAARRTTR